MSKEDQTTLLISIVRCNHHKIKSYLILNISHQLAVIKKKRFCKLGAAIRYPVGGGNGGLGRIWKWIDSSSVKKEIILTQAEDIYFTAEYVKTIFQLIWPEIRIIFKTKAPCPSLWILNSYTFSLIKWQSEGVSWSKKRIVNQEKTSILSIVIAGKTAIQGYNNTNLYWYSVMETENTNVK